MKKTECRQIIMLTLWFHVSFASCSAVMDAGLYKDTVVLLGYCVFDDFGDGRTRTAYLHLPPPTGNKHAEIPHCAWRRNDARLLRLAVPLRQEPGADGRTAEGRGRAGGGEKSSTKSITSWLKMIASPSQPYMFSSVWITYVLYFLSLCCQALLLQDKLWKWFSVFMFFF